MAALIQRHLEHHSAIYNRMCLTLKHCTDPVQIYRLRPLIQALHGTKARLLKAKKAYDQVKVMERLVQARDERLRALIAAGCHELPFPLLNDIEVTKGVMRMYAIYAMSQLSKVDKTLQRATQRLDKVMKR